MPDYDESVNLRMLSGLTGRCRAAFAFLCAVRLLPAYRRFHAKTGRGSPEDLESLVEELWGDLTMARKMTRAQLEHAGERCMALIPSEDDGWDEETQAYAEDVAAAVAYALQARLTGEHQEAAWAGRRVYEALDHYVQRVAGIDPAGPDDERRIMAHPAIQAEVGRQRQDLLDLASIEGSRSGTVRLEELRKRAEADAGTFFGRELRI